jgi:hypothetical protein
MLMKVVEAAKQKQLRKRLEERFHLTDQSAQGIQPWILLWLLAYQSCLLLSIITLKPVQVWRPVFSDPKLWGE